MTGRTGYCRVMTELLQATKDGIARAASMLRDGRLVAFGTETVYGLGGDATRAGSVAAIFEAKRRPRFNPLICHYPSMDAAFAHVAADDRARLVGRTFWPGPLTLVLRRRADCPVALLAGAGLDTLAVRVPDHAVARSMLRLAGVPVAGPSANLSGAVSPTTAAHVLDGLSGRIAAVLDSGPCAVGVESTVLDLSGPDPVLLRPGGVTLRDLEAVLGPVRSGGADHGALRSPGMMLSHYAPSLPVRLDASSVAANEALLAFGPSLPGARCVFQLSEAADTTEAAARLFEGLRWLDAEAPRSGADCIAVMAVPEDGLGLAVNDRLRRAAAPRG
jgi:L-threonylcarbamoyladenylate synthase